MRLNQAVANKLTSSVDYLRESFVGTLERCLTSLEKSNMDAHNITSNHLKQVRMHTHRHTLNESPAVSQFSYRAPTVSQIFLWNVSTFILCKILRFYSEHFYGVLW